MSIHVKGLLPYAVPKPPGNAHINRVVARQEKPKNPFENIKITLLLVSECRFEHKRRIIVSLFKDRLDDKRIKNPFTTTYLKINNNNNNNAMTYEQQQYIIINIIILIP